MFPGHTHFNYDFQSSFTKEAVGKKQAILQLSSVGILILLGSTFHMAFGWFDKSSK